MVGHWGTDAADLVPDLLAAMPHAGPQIAQTLLMLGYDDRAAVPWPDRKACYRQWKLCLVAGDTAARHAADFLADLALTSPASVAHLEPQLRNRLGDRWSRLSAAKALARLGISTQELAEPHSCGITDYGGRFVLAINLELQAVETIPALDELLARDHRFGVGSSADDIVWPTNSCRNTSKTRSNDFAICRPPIVTPTKELGSDGREAPPILNRPIALPSWSCQPRPNRARRLKRCDLDRQAGGLPRMSRPVNPFRTTSAMDRRTVRGRSGCSLRQHYGLN